MVQGLKKRLYTAASVIVGIDGKVLEEHHVGFDREGGAEISGSTLFDLASLTKPIVVVSLFMREIQKGNIKLEDRLEKFLPSKWIGRAFRGVTIDQVLSHRAGFPAHAKLFEHLIGTEPGRRKEEFVKYILSCTREANPVYSDLGYIILGYVLETVNERPLNEIFSSSEGIFYNQHLSFLPVKMPESPCSPPVHFAPPPPAVSTGWCHWRRRLLSAEVHDCNCYWLGGVSGHAGLFGTSGAVFSWASRLWKSFSNRDGQESNFWCSREVMSEFLRKPDDTSSWARGFDTPTPGNSTVAPYFSMRSVGHYGFTGTSFWIDLEDGFTIVLLTNRVYYETDREIFRRFRRTVHRKARLLNRQV